MLRADDSLSKACTMLKSLHLKNWRSIREATIEFTPLTVLIGANASGKTNVIDSLRFLSDAQNNGLVQVVYQLGGKAIKALGADDNESISVEYKIKFPASEFISDKLELLFLDDNFQFKHKHLLQIGDVEITNTDYLEPLQSDMPAEGLNDDIPFIDKLKKIEHLNMWQALGTFIATRWQFLSENFMPPLTASESSMSDLYSIEPNASNMVFVLDFMKLANPSVYNNLQEDLRFLLGYIDHIASKRDEREVHVAFHENKYPKREAPTVSAGTARILAVLAAVYALDMRNPEMPGLVVIEEPETSLNPSLLRKFVELLRGYTEDTEKPRQFILTTHNPAFLNHFQPEEVRVVSRDDDGNTVVNPIPDYIREIWLDEHGLGDVWLTNSFGGVAE